MAVAVNAKIALARKRKRPDTNNCFVRKYRNKLHNVVNLEYRIVPPEPKPTPATPPELVEPVPVEVPPSLEPQSGLVLQEVRKNIRIVEGKIW